MGRRKKQKDIEEAIAETKAAPNGHNSELTDDEKRALLIQHKGHYATALAVKKAADADMKNICKKAKAECGDAAVDEIKDAIAIVQPGGRAKIEAEIARKYRIARWMGLPVASEPRMFETEDRRPAVDIAYDNGKAAGMAGDTLQPPHDPSVPQYQKWMEGWHDGQAVLTSAFEKLPKVDAPSETKNEADTSDVPFAPPDAGAAGPMPEAPAMPG